MNTEQEREIYVISRMLGKEMLISVLDSMPQSDIDAITRIVDEGDSSTLTKKDVQTYGARFISRLNEIHGSSEHLNSESIHNGLARKRRFASGDHSDASLRGFAVLSEKSPEVIKKIISDESTELQAIVLTNIEYMKSERVLSLYEMDRRIQIVSCMATCSGPSREWLENLSDTLLERVRDASNVMEYDGVKSIVSIVERMSEPDMEEFLATMRIENPDLAESVRAMIMTFDDIVAMEESILDTIFDSVDQKRIALCIRDAEESVKKTVLASLTNQKQEMVNAELEMAKNQPASAISDAKKAVVSIAKDLEQRGKIVLSRS